MAEKEIGLNSTGKSGIGLPPKPKTEISPTGDVSNDVLTGPTFHINESKQLSQNLLDKVKTLENKDLLDFVIQQSPDQFLPWEKIILPSMGLYYDGKIPNGEVEVRPMGLTADKILATARLAQSGQSIDYMFKNCVKFSTSDFDPQDLIQNDRMFLLWYLRGITHGNTYEFMVTCSNDDCKAVSNHEYDLNNLSATIKMPIYQSEPIKVVLPDITKRIGREFYAEVRYPRGRDTLVMQRNQEAKRRIVGGVARNAKAGGSIQSVTQDTSLDTTVDEYLNMLIVKINGVSDRSKINAVIKMFTSGETALIRSVINDSQPGVDTTILIDCPTCHNEMKIQLPITESFFRPTDSRRIRE